MIWSISRASPARVALVAAALVTALAIIAPSDVMAQGDGSSQDVCRVVQVDMTPTSDLQIVVWLEDEAGNYVDTLYITRLTGSYGLGNRPGMMTFNSAWRWPYGRRTNTFPVWSHRHGMEWPLVEFQNSRADFNLSHPLSQSSQEHFYCRPLREDENQWDTQTCSSTVFTDKGVLSDFRTSRYPPRRDLSYVEGVDHDSVTSFRSLNPFDAISRPTPAGDQPMPSVLWIAPNDLPMGNYVLWVEVSKEWDFNPAHSVERYPSNDSISYSDYGLPTRGQPSVIYSVPFAISTNDELAIGSQYVGYGDNGDDIDYDLDPTPYFVDGDLRPPDGTISTGVDGSGASRLLLTVDGDDMYRVKVQALVEADEILPGTPSELQILDVTDRDLKGSFVAPGDDGLVGTVAGYEVRYLVAEPVTEENWSEATVAATAIAPDEPGQVQLFDMGDLVPRTTYWVGIRAFDECRNLGPVATVEVATDDRRIGEVPWCFVATAAYGSAMEQDVDMLRRFRDRYLSNNVTGELLVESYYTFGPALAKVVGSSDTLRRAARAGLAPIVEAVRELSPGQ